MLKMKHLIHSSYLRWYLQWYESKCKVCKLSEGVFPFEMGSGYGETALYRRKWCVSHLIIDDHSALAIVDSNRGQFV